MKKYSDASTGLITGIFRFTGIWTACSHFRCGVLWFQLCATGKDLSIWK